MSGLLDALSQTWPARLAQDLWSGVTLPRDVYQGKVNPLDAGAIGRATNMAMLPMMGTFAGAPAGAVGAGPVRQGIRAYHGSPYDFEKFDLSKIGTGEGAQAYGHGLYFAENEGVARNYRDALAKSAGRMYEVNINAKPEQFLDWDKPLAQMGEPARKSLDEIWGLPSPAAQAGMTGKDVYDALAVNLGGEAKRNSPHIQKYYPDVYKDDAATSALMREAGIPGIKYLDQGSRFSRDLPQLQSTLEAYKRQIAQASPVNAADRNTLDILKQRSRDLEEQIANYQAPTSNYVVFNDQLIDILRKYGLAGLAAIPPAALSGLPIASQQQAPELSQ